jgi:hypothetical protein
MPDLDMVIEQELRVFSGDDRDERGVSVVGTAVYIKGPTWKKRRPQLWTIA